MITFYFCMLLAYSTYCACDFQDVINIDFSDNYKNYSVEINIEEQIISGVNLGFGLWMRYMPLNKFYNDDNLQVQGQRIFFSEQNQEIQRKQENFIFSMYTESTKSSQLIFTQNFNDQTNMFDHTIYVHFQNTIKIFSIQFDYRNYEGEWFIFYIHFDFKQVLTKLGFYDLFNNEWRLQNFYDLPLFTNSISFDIGGLFRKQTFNQQTFSFQNFIGTLSGIFMNLDSNLIETGFDDCLWIADALDDCFDETNSFTTQNNYLNGVDYDSYQIPRPSLKKFVLNGWVKLDKLEGIQKEIVVLRIILDANYQDDENLGDRLLYLKYFQNQVSELNGFELTTQSYIHPIRQKYKTQPSDIISGFGSEYSDIFVKWHNIQFETSSIENDGQPQFIIFSPDIGRYKFKWNKEINYFSFPLLNIYLGGDKYSKTFFKGWLDQFQYISSCTDEQYEISIECHQSCQTCNGPNEISCTSCDNMLGRVFEELYSTCNCQANYYEKADFYQCEKLYEKQITAVDSFQDKIGIELCEFGYFLTQNGCTQCPYFVNFISKTEIICADCYLNSFKFATDLQCTYDYYTYNGDQDMAYELYQRNKEEIEIFSFNVLGINLIQSHSNFTVQYCDNNYFYLNQTCHTIQNCNQIQIVNLSSLKCQQCYLGYYLQNNNCKKCGENCGVCNSNRICFSCQDPQQYYLTFEGHSCKKCEIQFCIYCFSYFYQNDQIYSTLDINFQSLDYEQIVIFEGCALCQENYFFNFQNQKCEQKCQQILDSQNKQECFEKFKDCSFGVTTLNNQIECIKSLNQLSSIQSTECQQYQNCIQCINPSQQYEQPQCVVCDFGYYVDLLSGQCIQCPTECLQCLQQNQKYQDYWKQSIRGFYSCTFNYDGQKSYSQNAIIRDEEQLEIICFRCSLGYVRFNNKCIKDCDAFCSECKIINGISQCIKCPKTSKGFLKTKSKEGICLECPNNCAACFERSEEEIKKYNPYFIQIDEYKKYTHACFQLFNFQPEFNLFLDQKNLIPVRCDGMDQCYNKIYYPIIISCSEDDMLEYYPKYIYKSDSIFNQGFYYDYEIDTQFSLNQLSTQEVHLQFIMIQGSADCCQIHNGSFISTQLNQKVFSINKMIIEFLGSDGGTIFQIDKTFEILNFTNVVFRNIIFRFSGNNEQNQANYYQIIFRTLYENFTIQFYNCIFTSSSIEPIELNFIVNKSYNLILENVQFLSINIKNSILFTQNLNQNSQYSILLKNFTISESQFFNTTFLQLIYLNETLQQIKNQDFQIISSQFEQFTFLSIQSNYLLIKTSFYIRRMIIQQSSFTNSLVFLLKTLTIIDIQYLEILSAQFNSIIFFYIFKLNLNHLILKDIKNQNSSFISNQFQIHILFQEQYEKIENLFNNISFLDISTDNDQQFVKLQNYQYSIDFTVKFDSIVLFNIHSITNDLNILSLQDEKSFIDLECKFCFIKNLKVVRSYGVIEFKLQNSMILELSKIEVRQRNQNQKILHAFLDCASKNFLPHVTFMIISSYQDIQISNLSIKDCIIFNKPLIKILGQDDKYTSIEEKITLIDSEFQHFRGIIYDNSPGVSIIHFSSNQQSKIILNNLIFQENILHSYVEKQKIISSSSFLFQTNKAIIQFQNSIFTKNLATNTTNSILYINSFQLNIFNLSFNNNNQINNNQVILDSLLYQQISFSTLYNLFPIKSQGGNGYLQQSILIMKNISIVSSLSNKGGCFYIEQNGEGRILIEKSLFSETSTSFSFTSNSEGGCFYFDSSNSIFNLQISASIFNQTFSYKQGGAIFIVPSKTQNKVQLSNLQVTNTFSLENSFLSFKSLYIQNATSEVIFNNIKFNQSRNGFEALFSKFNGFMLKYSPSPLIFIKFGNISMYNIQFLDSYLQFFIQIEDGCLIDFRDIVMVNNTILNSQLIKINLNKNLSGQIIFERVRIRGILQYSFQLDTLNDFQCQKASNTLNYQDTEIGCKLNIDQNYQTNIDEQDIKIQEVQNLNCNKKIIFKKIENISSLIYLQITNKLQKLLMVESIIEQFYCKTCLNGIINIIIEQNNLQQTILMTDIQLLNNFCGLNGCINIQSQDSKNQNLRSLSENNSIENDQFSLVIKKGQFTNNEAYYGGSLYLNSISCIISESSFINNTAKKGGAIYYTSSKMQLQLLNTSISKNTAQIGGGVYMKNLVLGKILKFGVQIINNNSSDFANDISENPSSLTISLDSGITLLNKIIINNKNYQIIELIDISNTQVNSFNKLKYIMFPSGIKLNEYQYFDEKQLHYIPLNLSLRIIALNQFNQQEKQLEDAYCTLNTKAINIYTKEEEKNVLTFLSYKNVTFNNTSGDFNLDNLQIYFNPQNCINHFLRIVIQCNMIIVPIYNQNNKTYNYITDYLLYFDIQTYSCQIGEYLNHQTGGCVICDPQQNLYSLVKNATNCTYKDNNLIDEFTSQTIQLRTDYWRAQNKSTKIEYCQHFPSNCQGGWLPGDESCSEGHIGALCEQCDLYNIRNLGSFSRSNKYQCGNCNQIAGNIIILIIVSLWIILSILLSVDSTIQNIKQTILYKQFYFLGVNLPSQKYSTAVLVKFFTNYLQIITNLESFQIQIPKFLIGLFLSLGNPVTQMSYSYDCFFVSIVSMEMNYFRVIWILLQVLFFILSFIIIQFMNQILFKKQFELSSTYTALLFIYVFINLSIIESLIQQLSYRHISDIRWVSGNVSIQYDSEKHQIWIYELILPVLIIVGFLLPLFLFLQINKLKNTLNNSKSLKIWGYLTIEYKKETYYWEIVKIIQRQILILITNYYEDYIIVKASLVVIVLYSYSLIQTIQNPYKNNRLNQLEGNIMKVCSVSIILGSCIYLAQNNQNLVITWSFYFILSFMNFFLFFYLIIIILNTYIYQFHNIREKLFTIFQSLFPTLVLKHRSIRNFFIGNKNKTQKINILKAKLRQFIMPYVQHQLYFKKSIIKIQPKYDQGRNQSNLTLSPNKFFELITLEIDQ